MDCNASTFKQDRYDEIANEMKSMLMEASWKKDVIENNTTVMSQASTISRV